MSREFEESACALSSRRTPVAMQRDGTGSLTRDDPALRGEERPRPFADARPDAISERTIRDSPSPVSLRGRLQALLRSTPILI